MSSLLLVIEMNLIRNTVTALSILFILPSSLRANELVSADSHIDGTLVAFSPLVPTWSMVHGSKNSFGYHTSQKFKDKDSDVPKKTPRKRETGHRRYLSQVSELDEEKQAAPLLNSKDFLPLYEADRN
jgi:hypothetical protein